MDEGNIEASFEPGNEEYEEAGVRIRDYWPLQQLASRREGSYVSLGQYSNEEECVR